MLGRLLCFSLLVIGGMFIEIGAGLAAFAAVPNSALVTALNQDFTRIDWKIIRATSSISVVYPGRDGVGADISNDGAKPCFSDMVQVFCPKDAILNGAATYRYTEKDGGLSVIYFNGLGKMVGYGFDADRDGIGNSKDTSEEAFKVSPFAMAASAAPATVPGHLIKKPFRGDFSVDSSGAALYSIPFELPPAINGAGPEIGLVYNSSLKQGPMRMGWSIYGMSSISRCVSKKHRDGFVEAVTVNLGEKQRFCLDGAPLVLVPGTTGATYGKDGAEYYMEKRNDLIVRSVGIAGSGPDYFEAISGDGKRFVYGRRPVSFYRTDYGDSKTTWGLGSRLRRSDRSEVYVWKLDSVTDTSGNTINYYYDSEGGALPGYTPVRSYPYLVRYSGNVEGREYDVEVEFKWRETLRHSYWETRVDNGTIIQGEYSYNDVFGTETVDGLVIENPRKLTNVYVRVGSKEIVKEYKIDYEPVSSLEPNQAPVNNVTAITECAKGVCTAPIKFGWEGKVKGEESNSLCAKDNVNLSGGEPAFSTDYLVSRPIQKNFSWENSNYRSQLIGDFNGDDQQDVAVMYTFKDGSSSRMTVDVASSSGDGQFGASGVTFSELIGSAVLNHRLAADLNSDGYTDLIATNSSASGWNAYVVMNNRDGTFAKPVYQRLSNANFIDDQSYQKVTGDFNGDGKIDILAFGVGHGSAKNDLLFRRVSGLMAFVALGNGDGTFSMAQGGQIAASSQIAKSLANNRFLFTGDFNGDGISDIATTYFANELDKAGDPFKGSETVVAFGTDSGRFSSPVVQRWGTTEFPKFWEPNSYEKGVVQTTDINGDGLTDFLTLQGSYGGILPDNAYDTNDVVVARPDFRRRIFVAFIGNGNGTFRKKVYEDVVSTAALSALSSSGCQRTRSEAVVADFNDDGFADISYGSGNFWLGRGDGRFLKQGGRFVAGDTIQPTGGGVTVGGFVIPDNTYGNYAFDTNRDGNLDVVEVLVDANGLSVGTNAYAKGVTQQVISRIVDGSGKVIAIRYEPVVARGAYRKANTARYPLLDVGSGRTVVSSVNISDGIGGEYNLSYRYSGLVADVMRKQVLGFGSTSVMDGRDKTSTNTVYSQAFPMEGLVRNIERRSETGTLLDNQINAWDFRVETNQIGSYNYAFYTTYKTAEIADKYNTDGGFIGRIDRKFENFDEFGNPRQISSTRSDGFKASKTLVIENNPRWDNHYAARVMSDSETRQSPDYVNSVTRKQDYTYYSNGLMRSRIIQGDSADTYRETIFGYDGFGRITSISESGSSSAKYLVQSRSASIRYIMPPYSSTGAAVGDMEIVRTNAEGHESREFYDVKLGLTKRTVDPNGLESRWRYDDLGDLILEERADGTYSTYSRNPCDEFCPPNAAYRMHIVDPSIAPVDKYYDMYDRELRTRAVGFLGEVVFQDNAYDVMGRLNYETKPYFKGASSILKTEISYDLYDRPLSSTSPEQGYAEYKYYSQDGKGVRVEKIQRRSGLAGSVNLITESTRNLSDNPVSTKNAAQAVTQYKYDAFENIGKVIDPSGNIISVSYDALGRVKELLDPDFGMRQFGVDAYGLRRFILDNKNQQIDMKYDRLDRIVQRTKKEGSDRWVYDQGPYAIGRKVAEESATGSAKTIYYDSTGRIEREIQKVGGSSYEMSYGYDAYSRLNKITYPSGFIVENSFNTFGYLASVNTGGTSLWRLGGMNATGERTEETFGNGVKTTRRFHAMTGRIEGINTLVSGAAIQNLEYVFDSLGNLEKRREVKKKLEEKFEYDSTNRLTKIYLNSVLSKRHEYDLIGNIKVKSDFGSDYVYGQNGAGPHAVTQITKKDNSRVNFLYDKNGNMINGHGLALAYASFDKPVSVSSAASNGLFEYDANEERVRYSSKSVETVYINPRWDIGVHYEREQSGSVIKHKHYINAGKEPVALYVSVTGGSQTEMRYLHKDHLGSVSVITNEAGAVVEDLSYHAFGERRGSTWANATSTIIGKTTHHGFTGHEHMDDFGLINMNARMYDARIGRFLSADSKVPTLQNVEGLNRYAYVFNNPLSFTDPSGNTPYGMGPESFGDRAQQAQISKQGYIKTTSGSQTDYGSGLANSNIVGISQNPSNSSGTMVGRQGNGEYSFVNIQRSGKNGEITFVDFLMFGWNNSEYVLAESIEKTGAFLDPIMAGHGDDVISISGGKDALETAEKIIHGDLSEAAIKASNIAIGKAKVAKNAVFGIVGKSSGSKSAKSRNYDRPATETKSGKAVKQKDAVDDWNNFIGPNQTNVDPRDGLPDPDRIWSADGTRSIRFGEHEMGSKPSKMHYHKETWYDTSVENVLQRIPQ